MVTPLRTIVVLLMIVALFSCALTQTHAAEPGADSSLVIAALDVLKRDYPRPVKTVDLLNAAIAALRKATNLGPEKIPDLSAGLEDSKAVSTFRQEFADAVRAGAKQEADLAYVATRGMLASLHDDPHVRYYDPAQWAERQQRAQSNYVGIGVIIRSKKDTSGTGLIFVEQVVSGSPAQAAGLRPLDRILEADGKPLQGMTTQEASGLIRGPAGSTLNLKIKRGGDVLSISIARAPITIPPVEAQMIQPGIVYVRLRAFPEGVGDLLRNQLRAMESRSTVVGVILDLRGNGGDGRFRDGASVAGTFLKGDTVLAHLSAHGKETSLLKASGPTMLPQAKLVILVDNGTSLNAEIVTASVQDEHRGTIVGEKTEGVLGAGRSVSLPAGGMYVKTDEVAGPKNEQIDHVGITPDIAVSLTEDDMGRGQDPQLDAALKAVR